MRAAVADAVGSLAAGLQEVSGSPAPGDVVNNDLLKGIFEGMNDFDHNVQLTAAAAIVQVGLGPGKYPSPLSPTSGR